MPVQLTPPPPTKDSALDRWLNLIHRLLTGAGQIDGSQVDLTGYVKTDGTTDITGPQVVSVSSSSDALRITQEGSGNSLVVEDSTNPDSTPFTITSDGRVLIGVTSSSFITGLQVEGNGGFANFVGKRYSSDTSSFSYFGYKARGSLGSPSAVSNNDAAFGFFGFAYDGTNYIASSGITGVVDGTPGTNDMPGRLVFSTTSVGASAITERFRIDSKGFSKFSGSVGRGTVVTKTGNFTVADTENWIVCNGTGTITVTLPTASSYTGREIMIKTIAAQAVNSASSNVAPIGSATAGTAILAATAGKWATLVSDGTNWIVMQAG